VRSVDALKTASASLRVSLRQLADGDLTARQFIGLDRLRTELDDRVAAVDPIAASDLEEELGTWLLDRGVGDPWGAAAGLAGAGADIDWLQRAAAVMGPTVLDTGLAWVADSVTVESLLDQLKDATRQISELVSAVRSYTQVGRASMQLVHVGEGIDSTLVMLGHRLRDQSVTVERDYGPALPRIEAFAGELNQVWTNLIANALDALASSGADHAPTLRITTRLDGDSVVVDVADNGPGMPPEVAARAFEAFFTTKDVGKGTGLGLDIARRIVDERHGGTISIDSQPGQTVFHVRLPMHRRR
jgi:signal transduction histidine kinase